MKTRRQFLKTALVASAAYPLPLKGATGAPKKLRIGIITDIHKDIIHDADERLGTFLDEMKKEKVDAILQMGDFCQPKPANKPFVDRFNAFPAPKFHVLGNHDMDGGFKREQVVAFFGMKSRYYSFDLGGFHFIILDANDKPDGWKGGYSHYLAPDQVAWLEEDLDKTTLNTFVISHQSLERPACIDNQADVRAILEAAKTADGKRKVAACFNGHWHIDHERVINGIPYVHINSASYYWVGSKFQHASLDPELAKKYPVVSSTSPYTKPLFTVLEIDPVAGKFTIRGAKSEWLGKSPQELNYTSTEVESAWMRPAISPVEETFGKV